MTEAIREELRLFKLLLRGKATKEQEAEYWQRWADPTEKRLGKPLWAMDAEAFDEYNILDENLRYGEEKGGYCKLCKNRGYTVQKDGTYKRYVTCRCMEQRKQKQAIENSGFAELITSKSFENYTVNEEWQRNALRTVKAWAVQERYPFLYLGGKSGAGKTHLAIAAFYSLVQRGVRGKFVSWRTESRDLKMRMTEVGYYDAKIQELKKIPLLLVDDFLWTNGANPSEEDFKLAKEIIDERQANGRRTIFTANWTIRQINGLSEVIGGRIYQACGSKTNFAITYGSEAKNYRAKTLPTLTDFVGEKSPFEED